MKTRVINLTAHEARAFQRGATILVRECKGIPLECDAVNIEIDNNDRWFYVLLSPIKTNGMRKIIGSVDAPCQPGDLLIGREAWRPRGVRCNCYEQPCDCCYVDVTYPADGVVIRYDEWAVDDEWDIPDAAENGNLPSICMPQWAVRVRRIVSAVTLKRCQELTEGECEAMGYSGEKHYLGHGDFEEVSPAEQFAEANAKLWDANKFVWVTKVKEEE